MYYLCQFESLKHFVRVAVCMRRVEELEFFFNWDLFVWRARKFKEAAQPAPETVLVVNLCSRARNLNRRLNNCSFAYFLTCSLLLSFLTFLLNTLASRVNLWISWAQQGSSWLKQTDRGRDRGWYGAQGSWLAHTGRQYPAVVKTIASTGLLKTPELPAIWN